MKKLLYTFLFFGTAVCGAVPAAVDFRDYPALDYRVSKQAVRLDNWRVAPGDNTAALAEDFDDSAWRKLSHGKALTGLEFKSGMWCVYRTDLILPADFHGKDLLFELGKISAYDELYVNGKKCGFYGTEPPKLIFGCSDVRRRYPVTSRLLHPGKNSVALRVYLGKWKGIVPGRQIVRILPDGNLHIQLRLKSPGAHSLERGICGVAHLDKVVRGKNLFVNPEIFAFFSGFKGEIAVKILPKDNTRVLQEKRMELTLHAGSKVLMPVRLSAPSIPGQYRLILQLLQGARELYHQETLFEVISDAKKLDYAPKEERLVPTDVFVPAAVTPGPAGHMGPREGDSGGVLFDAPAGLDSRSGLCTSVRFSPGLGAPQWFMANLRPVPEGKSGRFHRTAGHKFDALTDSWLLGMIRPNRVGKPEKVSVTGISWINRSWRYAYADGIYLNFSLSSVMPQWRAETNSDKLRVFENIGKYGIGLPSHMIYEKDGKAVCVPAEKGLRGKDMSANWILVFFHGAKNWDEFDLPVLFVLEKRPKSVRTYANAMLLFSFAEPAGTVQGMPLYGVTVQSPETTGQWLKKIPSGVVKRCIFWSRVLVHPILDVERRAWIDWKNDRVMVQDKFTHGNIADVWNTRGIKLAPLSSIFPLAAKAPDFRGSVDCKVKDLQMGTLQGPLVAAVNSSQVGFNVDGLLKFVREVRYTPSMHSSLPEQRQINSMVRTVLRQSCPEGVFEPMFRNGRFVPGGAAVFLTQLMLCRPYLDKETGKLLDEKLQSILPKTLLASGKSDAPMQRYLSKDMENLPLQMRYSNPATGLSFVSTASARPNYGIDMVYFTLMNCFTAELFARTYNQYDWAKANWDLLKAMFNSARNSHDWNMLASWDTFGGIRIGNGLQESGGIFAGCVAIARLAHHFGDAATRDLAAYHAAMQLTEMTGALYATEYIEAYRPYPASHSRIHDIEFTVKARPYCYAEINEFSGLSKLLIGTANWVGSPSGFIESPLPEVMRPYQELWRRYTDDFYDEKYDRKFHTDRRIGDRISLDAYIYQTRRDINFLKEMLEVRKALNYPEYYRMTDLRGFLDANNKISLKKLF